MNGDRTTMMGSGVTVVHLGDVLREQGRTKTWVARKLGISPSLLSRWISGERNVPEHRIRQLAELLGVPEEAIRGNGGGHGAGE